MAKVSPVGGAVVEPHAAKNNALVSALLQAIAERRRIDAAGTRAGPRTVCVGLADLLTGGDPVGVRDANQAALAANTRATAL